MLNSQNKIKIKIKRKKKKKKKALISDYERQIAILWIYDAYHCLDPTIHGLSKKEIWWYTLSCNKRLRSLSVIVTYCLIFLPFFEYPCTLCINKYAVLLLEVFCMLVLLFQQICVSNYLRRKQTKKKKQKNYLNVLSILIIVFLFVEIVLDLIFYLKKKPYLRLIRIFRITFLFSCHKSYGETLNSFQYSLKYIFHLFLFIVLIVAVYGSFLFLLFYDTKSEYFQNYWESLYNLFVCMTTVNFPDIMMNLFERNEIYSIFFIFFLVLILWFLSNLLLAILYNNYKEQLSKRIFKKLSLRSAALKLSYNIYDPQNEKGINYREFSMLLNSKLLPHNHTNEQLQLIYKVLTLNSNSTTIKLDGWLKLISILKLTLKPIYTKKSFSKKHQFLINNQSDTNNGVSGNSNSLENYYSYLKYFLKKIQNIMSKIIKKIRNFQKKKKFEIICNTINLFTFVFVLLDIFLKLNLLFLEIAFIIIFVLEILIRIISMGWKQFHSNKFINESLFDLLLIILLIIAIVINSIIKSKSQEQTQAQAQAQSKSQKIIYILFLIRSIKILKLLFFLPKIRTILSTITKFIPIFSMYLLIIFSIMYCYAIVGMFLFKDKQNIYKKKLIGTSYDQNNYYANNFDTFWNSLIIIFELAIVNNWHVFAEAFVILTNKSLRIYFISFWILVPILLLTIITASSVEIFQLQVQWDFNYQRQLKSQKKFETDKRFKMKKLKLKKKIMKELEEEKTRLKGLTIPKKFNNGFLNKNFQITNNGKNTISILQNGISSLNLTIILKEIYEKNKLSNKLNYNDLPDQWEIVNQKSIFDFFCFATAFESNQSVFEKSILSHSKLQLNLDRKIQHPQIDQDLVLEKEILFNSIKKNKKLYLSTSGSDQINSEYKIQSSETGGEEDKNEKRKRERKHKKKVKKPLTKIKSLNIEQELVSEGEDELEDFIKKKIIQNTSDLNNNKRMKIEKIQRLINKQNDENVKWRDIEFSSDY
ncbi:two pore channel [Anaeramoeba flamelloides]|uniref:Two pore channel n=1 Tax=Anaeramoeba flamelloides TaxID=1746091 RepID=A0AAV7ZUG5_9EUKA|nr:two pore channel [Anaeramoeba flamelloides]